MKVFALIVISLFFLQTGDAITLEVIFQSLLKLFGVRPFNPEPEQYHSNDTTCFTEPLPETCTFYQQVSRELKGGNCTVVEELALGLLKVATDTCPNMQSWDGTHTWYGHIREMKRQLRLATRSKLRRRQACNEVETGLGNMFTGVHHKCPHNVMFRAMRGGRYTEIEAGPECSQLSPFSSYEVQNGMLCWLCRFLANRAVQLAGLGKRELETKLAEVCVVLGPFAGKCTKLEEKYIDKLFDMIQAHLSPDKICYKLKLCTSRQLSALYKAGAWDDETLSSSTVANNTVSMDETTVQNDTTLMSAEVVSKCLQEKKILNETIFSNSSKYDFRYGEPENFDHMVEIWRLLEDLQELEAAQRKSMLGIRQTQFLGGYAQGRVMHQTTHKKYDTSALTNVGRKLSKVGGNGITDVNYTAEYRNYQNLVQQWDLVQPAGNNTGHNTVLGFTPDTNQNYTDIYGNPLSRINMYGQYVFCDGRHTPATVCDPSDSPMIQHRAKRTAILIQPNDPQYEGPNGLALVHISGNFAEFENFFGVCNEATLKWLARYGLVANRIPCPQQAGCQSPNPPGYMSFIIKSAAIDGFEWVCSPCKSGGQTVKKSVRDGSIFQGSHLTLRVILKTWFIWANYPALKLSEIKNMLGDEAPSDNTIIHWYYTFRNICEQWCTDHAPLRKLGGPGRIVEIDESLFFRGKYGIGHWHREQQWVFGLVERGTPNVIVIPVDDRTANTLLAEIVEWVIDGNPPPGQPTWIMSDMWAAYGGINHLPNNYFHQAVNHKYRFVRPGVVPGQSVHTQTIEATWGRIKESLKHLKGFKNHDLFPTWLFQYMFRRAHENKKIWQHTLQWGANQHPVPH